MSRILLFIVCCLYVKLLSFAAGLRIPTCKALAWDVLELCKALWKNEISNQLQIPRLQLTTTTMNN